MTAIGERTVALSSKLVDKYGGRAGKVVRVFVHAARMHVSIKWALCWRLL